MFMSPSIQLDYLLIHDLSKNLNFKLEDEL